MLSRELRRRLSRVVARVLPAAQAAVAQDELREQLAELSFEPEPAVLEPAPMIFPVDETAQALSAVLGGRERESDLGRCWEIEADLAERWPPAAALSRRLLRAVELRQPPEDLALARDFLTDGLVFLDIETAGLSGVTLFLAGTLEFSRARPVLRFFLARDYHEEAALLGALCAHLGRFSTLATFNGKSFDVPYIRDRLRYHRLKLELPEKHLDLLHTARRRWRGLVPDCKLQTLERRVCRRVRQGDLPSAEIPRTYHEFVATGDARLMAAIVQHNALDLLTLAELLAAQLEYDEP